MPSSRCSSAVPMTVAGSFLDLQPVSRCGESGCVLALPRHRFGQADKSVGTNCQRADPAGKPLAQACGSLRELSLRAQSGTAQEARFPYEPEPLLGSQHLSRLELLEGNYRLTAIET